MAAAKKLTVVPQPQTPVDEDTLIAEQTSPDQTTEELELERLVAEQRATAARIRELKAMQPKQSPLEREIAKQEADNGGAWVAVVLSHRVARRVKYGQPLAEALDAVLSQYKALVLHLLTEAK